MLLSSDESVVRSFRPRIKVVVDDDDGGGGVSFTVEAWLKD